MMIGRRRFLALLGIGAASAPAATKAVLDTEVVSLTSLSGSYLPLYTGSGTATPDSFAQDNQENAVKASTYLRTFGRLPAYMEEEIRNRCKYVNGLDPDIANKRSWSLSFKVLVQQERNFEREMARLKGMGLFETAQRNFAKVAGFRWPW